LKQKNLEQKNKKLSQSNGKLSVFRRIGGKGMF